MLELNRIYCGDCLSVLNDISDESINCCVTSPPYWGLRNYGVAGQLGLEPTPQEYVLKMVKIFSEVRRVLKHDGTCWLNLGDSYARQAGDDSKKDVDSGMQTGRTGKAKLLFKSGNNKPPPGLKSKDLCGIPWRVAIALQENGWYLRQDIIWHKPNVMPESVKDRCTKSHEYIFLLTKSPKYYFDSKAMREPGVIPAGTKGAKGSVERQNQPGVNARPPEYKIYDGFRNKRSVWTVRTKPFKGAHFATFPPQLIEPCILAGCPENGIVIDPFIGSGTVAMVAKKHKRNFIGVELNPEYVKLAEQRLV